MGKHEQPDLTAATIKGGVATQQRHDSAHKHVTGEAVYIDDITIPVPEPASLGLMAIGGALLMTRRRK